VTRCLPLLLVDGVTVLIMLLLLLMLMLMLLCMLLCMYMRNGRVKGSVCVRTSPRCQCCSQGIDLLFQLGHPTVSLLLALSTGYSDDALSVCFGASLAAAANRLVDFTLDFQLTTSFTSSRPLQVVSIVRGRSVGAVVFGGTMHLVGGAIIVGCLNVLVGCVGRRVQRAISLSVVLVVLRWRRRFGRRRK